MRFERFGDEERDALLVLGWGNRFEHTPVRWLVDHVVDAGYTVHGCQLPVVITDFDADYLDPVVERASELDDYALLTHSTGGLIGEFLDAPAWKVHLSPWWGFHENLDNAVVSLAMRLPISTPILPAGIDRAGLGELATDDQIADLPTRAAPTFLREAKRGQERLPDFEPETTSVFYTPGDQVVSAPTIEARTPPANRVAYDGGHELFCSPSRTDHIDTVLAALETGPGALEQ